MGAGGRTGACGDGGGPAAGRRIRLARRHGVEHRYALFTLSFHRFRRAFAEVEHALRAGELAQHATAWKVAPRDRRRAERRGNRAGCDRAGLLAAHRYVFGPVAWFIVLGRRVPCSTAPAPCCPSCGTRAMPRPRAFGNFAGALSCGRLAPGAAHRASFAAAGDFADAIYCWRAQAPAGRRGRTASSRQRRRALGVRLGDPLHQEGSVHYRPELGTGDVADVDHLQQAMGLIWRTLVLWLFLVFLVSLAHALASRSRSTLPLADERAVACQPLLADLPVPARAETAQLGSDIWRQSRKRQWPSHGRNSTKACASASSSRYAARIPACRANR